MLSGIEFYPLENSINAYHEIYGNGFEDFSFVFKPIHAENHEHKMYELTSNTV